MSALMLAALAISAGAAQISVNGEIKELPAYNIKNNNYFKLRDVANILKGTETQFDVQWNEASQTINLVSGTPYSGTESVDPVVIQGAVARNSDVYIQRDGFPVLLKAYNINFNNYFKLRDLGALFNFNITWDENTQLIGIDTSSPYEYPEYAGTDFALNTKYLTLLGKRKGEIDAICGTPEHIYNPKEYIDHYIYPCGIEASYGLFFAEHTDNSPLHNVSVKLSDLFFNCPETVTMEQVQSIFVETVPYDDSLSINYCGKILSIPFENGVAKADDYARISVNGNFQSTVTEVVYVGAEWANTLEKTEGRIAHEFVMENFKEFIVPGGQTHSYENINFELVDISGDGIRELYVEVYDDILQTEYRAIYVRNGNGFVFAMGGADFSVVHNYIEGVYYICENDYVDGENYQKSTQRYYSWTGMNKTLVLENVSEYKNDTDYIYFNGIPHDQYSDEQRQYYYNFVMFYPVYSHPFSGLLHS